jgi:hypothetical protein
LVRDGHRAPDGLLQHANTDALALVLQRHRQSGQNDHGYRIAAHAFADAVGYFHGVGLPNC